MNRICLLPEHVANQIAAGEVVERPASAVKELVENALDAQASHIRLEVQAGGRSLLRVTDDGVGMSRDDALLCLERHATSKIRAADDLLHLDTLGFRGEALPSLASVSRFTLTTRDHDPATVAATQIVVHGGKIIAVHEAGAPPGTSIEVRQLFFNVPARRKFLRSDETERAHIQHVFAMAALGFPEVAFDFILDGRSVWQWPALKTGPDAGDRFNALRERLGCLYGPEIDWVPVDATAEIDSGPAEAPEDTARARPVRFWGFLGAPGFSRATRESQHLFVNRRPVENRGLSFALLEGCHTVLMKGRFPLCCLFLELDPGEVDVNIHPTKREVKFQREAEVRRCVSQAVHQAFLRYHAPPASLSTPPEPVPEPVRPAIQPSLAWPVPPAVAATPGPATPPPPPPVPGPASDPAPPAARPASAAEPGPGLEPAPALSVPLRFLGVIGNLYVVLESDRGLVLLDQHAAHERVLFEQMLNRLERDPAPSQRLLLAETIELPPRDAQFLREQLATLSRLGVGLSEFGERTFLLDALPPFVRNTEPRQFILDLVDELKAAGQDVNSLRLGEPVVAKTVCRHAVKAHDPLTGPELERLLGELRQCAMPYTCPHGRPTLIELNYRDLGKKFGRLV